MEVIFERGGPTSSLFQVKEIEPQGHAHYISCVNAPPSARYENCLLHRVCEHILNWDVQHFDAIYQLHN